MAKISYDREVDALYIRLKQAAVTTDVISEGIALDYDGSGQIAGVEILDARKRLDDQAILRSDADADTSNVNITLRQHGPLALSGIKQQVLDALKRVETEEYPVSDWYLGALYALENPFNPDRISQAAQSLRELLEKLPRVIQASDVHTFDFQGMRKGIRERFERDKSRYKEVWKGEKIDARLAKTLRRIDRYLELNLQPTRRDQIQIAIGNIDPMADYIEVDIQKQKRDAFYELWNQVEGYAHHRTNYRQDERKFRTCVSVLERLIYDLLAPITARDQQEIQSILSRSEHSDADADTLYSLISRRGANYVYFFTYATDPTWIPFLVEQGFFRNPPDAEYSSDGFVQFPFWPELEYLKKVCKEAPDVTVNLALDLPTVENPRVYQGILEIALSLDGMRSARLKPKILEFVGLDHRIFPLKFPELLAHWTADGQTGAALELANVLVQFGPDPKAEEKRRKWSENDKNKSNGDEGNLTLMMATKLEPVPRFSSIYLEVLNNGVNSLIQREPYKVALMLIDATATMIRLGKHQDDLDSGKSTDFLEIWCPRLTKPRRDYPDLRESLVHTLTYACESVWKRSSDLAGDLDTALRNQKWDVFKRIRQHLYGLHLSQHTRPLIREFILAHDDYSHVQYGYEFQRMVRLACEYFGTELLTVKERSLIFDAILVGPPKGFFREWMGEHFTDSEFGRQKRNFHHRQLRPFAPVLFGRYLNYFEELEASKAATKATDESYSPVNESVGGTVRSRSPKSSQELANLTDQDLLDYINRWDNERQDRDDWLIEITIEALAGRFQRVLKDHIIPSDARLDFWIGNRHNIHRPIYVRAMINAMQDLVKAKIHDKLDKWLQFCEWVLSHSDPQNEHPFGTAQLLDRSSETPSWHTARRAACDFIETCLEQDSEVPISNREHIGRLLDMICTQYDWLLDQKEQVPLNGDGRLIEAIDSTRGRALENLVKMGLWVRRHDDNAEVADMKAILDERFDLESDCPLKPTEYAILGRLYQSIFDLDSHWAAASKSFVFPQNDFPAWLQAFAGFLRYSRPEKRIFDRVRDEYQFALDNLGRLELRDPLGEDLKDILGQHLFKYYAWGVLPLKGTGSLLEGFYEATDDDPKRWATLFNHVGHLLRKTGNQLVVGLKEKILAFFEWRLEAGDPLELREFGDWLEAECLDLEWRLKAFHKVLQIDDILDETVNPEDNNGDSSATWLPMDATQALRAMLLENTPRVVECFAKLTDVAPRSSVIYIPIDDARAILKAGFEHENENVHTDAEHAKENLYSHGILRHSD